MRSVLIGLAVAAAFVVSACTGSTQDETTISVDAVRSDPLGGAELRATLAEQAEIMGAAGAAKSSAISSQPPPGTTVSEFYEIAAEQGAIYEAALVNAEAASLRLSALVREAVQAGTAADIRVDLALLAELEAEVNLWLEAERLQNDPDLCRETLPPGTDDLLFEEAVNPAFVDCMLELVSDPVVERGSFDAAVRLQEIGAELGRAWSD